MLGLLNNSVRAASANGVKSFSSLDRMFQFKYSDMLVRCRESKQQAGWWIPDNACEAYMPVCDDSTQGSRTLVCLAYPKAQFKNSPTFEAATFSVAEVMQAASEKVCLTASPDWVVYPNPNGLVTIINGIKFRSFEVDGAGLGHSFNGQVYRTFHRGRCYELAIRTVMSSPGAFDPGTIKEFTKADWNEVQRPLKQALESFRFVK